MNDSIQSRATDRNIRHTSPRIGFNHNVRYRGQVYHVQTEDSGRDKGHIYTHVFVGGTVISSHKTDYLADDRAPERIVVLMQESHKRMMRRLCNGEFDGLLGPFNDPAANEAPPPALPTVAACIDRLSPLRHNLDMVKVSESLDQLEHNITGILGAALVDHSSGLCIGTVGVGINVHAAAAGSTEVMQAELRVMRELEIEGGIEDMLITLAGQYHVVRPVNDSLFLYLAMDRQGGNLGLARHKLAAIGDRLALSWAHS